MKSWPSRCAVLLLLGLYGCQAPTEVWVEIRTDVPCARVDETGIAVGPLPIGQGTVKCAHGILPLPAPATVELLTGFPVYAVDETKETVTPTGAALLTDYVLTVSVSISSGVDQIVSAFPATLPYKVEMAVGMILLVMLINAFIVAYLYRNRATLFHHHHHVPPPLS